MTEAVCLHSVHAAISYGSNYANCSAKYQVFWIYTLLIINYDVSEGVNAGKCVELNLSDNLVDDRLFW